MVDADRCMSVDSVSGAVQATSIEETEMEPLSNIMERVIEYLVKVLNEASRGWMPRADPDIMDVSLVEQAVDQLIKLIDPSTRAFDLLLAFPGTYFIELCLKPPLGIIEILMRNILNPMAKIRYAIWRLATAISRKNESAAESLYKWAISNRLQADQVSVHCSEYYQLIEQYIRTNLVHPNREQVFKPLFFLPKTFVSDRRHETIASCFDGRHSRVALRIRIRRNEALQSAKTLHYVVEHPRIRIDSWIGRRRIVFFLDSQSFVL